MKKKCGPPPKKKRKKKYRSGKQSNNCQGSGGVDYKKTTLGNSGGKQNYSAS